MGFVDALGKQSRRAIKLFLLLAFLVCPGLYAQSPGDMTSISSPGLVTGITAASNSESSLEHVNLYNGNLNVTVPVFTIGGRGQAAYTMLVPVQRRWNVDVSPQNGEPLPYSWGGAFDQPDFGTTPYSPGGLVIRRSGSQNGVCSFSGQVGDLGPYISRLVWVTPDGTETALRDTNYDGQAQGTQASDCNSASNYTPVNRGTIFASQNGSGLTFVADSPISDTIFSSSHDGEAQSGWLYFKDGRKYRIDSLGNVASVVDRNGNTIALTYPNDNASLTDALGRSIVTELNFTNAGSQQIPSGLYEPSWDLVHYPGYSGAQRTVRVNKDALSAASSNGTKSYAQLFPELSGADAGQFDPEIIRSIVLADGSSTYSFQYNEYGELTQMTLPTGGVYHYFYQQTYSCPAGSGGGGGDGVITISNYAGKAIYRRLTERDELSDGVNISSKTTYQACAEANPDPNHSGRSETTVYVDRYDGAGNLLRHEAHYFYGDPSSPNAIPGPTSYPNWSDGLEFRVDIGDSASPARLSSQSVWQQRPCGVSVNTGAQEPCWFGDPGADSSPLHDPQLCQANRTWDGSVTSGQVFAFDSYNNQTDRFEFDFGPAPAVAAGCTVPSSGFLRHTQTAYEYGSGYVQSGIHLWNLPLTSTVLDGQGKQIAKRTFGYDAGSVQTYSAITGSSAVTGPRGNPTSDQQWWSFNNTNIGHQYAFDVAGDIWQDTDPNGNITTLSYSDSQNTYAHVTTVTLPQAAGVTETMQMGYDYSSGFLTSFRDVNGAVTSYSYNAGDALDRLQGIGRPDGGTTNFSYPSLTEAIEADDSVAPADQATQTTVFYDGLRRPIQQWSREVAASGNVDYLGVYQSYDGVGRLNSVSNPIRGNSIGGANACNGSLLCTVTSYDGLDRVTSVVTPDQLTATATYSGNNATVTDQAQTVRQYTTDGLGRLTQVSEAPGAAQIATTYCYDLLDNLSAVYQPIATACNPQSYSGQVRHFSFDSLSRLEASQQPEAANADGSEGGTSFAYDNNGNLVWRSDNRGVETCFAYDPLNRLSQKVYYEGSVPAGQTGQCGSIPSSAYDPNTTAVTYSYGASGNGIGSLAQIANGNSITTYSSYDPLGRVTGSSQTTAGQVYSFGYTYNLGGALISETYPSGRQLTITNDNLNRTTQISGVLGAQPAVNYLSNAAYAPHGALQSYSYGNQLARTYSYNARLQTGEITDALGSTTLLDLLNTWDNPSFPTTRNNGQLRGQQISTNAGAFIQSFGYDAFNRLASITDNGGGTNTRGYQYDVFGNVTLSSNTGSFPISPFTPPAGTQYSLANHLPANVAAYDAAGNITGLGNCANCLAYDAENQQVSAALSGSATAYLYDGSGNRIAKQASGAITVYVYDALGQLAAEYTTASPSAPCQTCYLSWDHLGSTRLVTDQSGAVVGRHDYLPFGEEIGAGNAGRPAGWGALDTIRQKFTGQERDDESSLDYFQARYYSFAQGRFTSPDPLNAGADLYNPQSWNGYAYVVNNPLSDVDPDGLDSCTGSSCVSLNPSSPPQPGQLPGGGSGFGDGGSIFSISWGGGPPKAAKLPGPALSLVQLYSSLTAEDPLVDSVSGGLDVITFGLSEHLRNEDGVAAEVHKDSNWYRIGYATGFALSFLDGGELFGGGEALVDTAEIRFSQSSVKRIFSSGQSIEETAEALRSGALASSDLPAIRVFVKDGAVYTLDNRRLVAASLAGVRIKVRLATPAEVAAEFGPKFVPIKGGQFIKIRGVE